MTVAYATTAELAAYLGTTAPSDAERLLERASELMDDVAFGSFEIDSETELPTDTDVAAAMRDAACAQVEFWSEVGEGNDVDGLAGTQASVTGYQGKRAPVLAPRAKRFLKAAGLLRLS